MRVLAVNAGSSTLKLRLVAADDNIEASLEIDPWDGSVEPAGLAGWLGDLRGVDAIGHRVVHGGDRYREAVRIRGDVLDGIAELTSLAPLHQPRALAAVEAVRAVGVPGVAVPKWQRTQRLITTRGSRRALSCHQCVPERPTATKARFHKQGRRHPVPAVVRRGGQPNPGTAVPRMATYPSDQPLHRRKARARPTLLVEQFLSVLTRLPRRPHVLILLLAGLGARTPGPLARCGLRRPCRG